jgi:hypothetical protein
MFRLNTTSAEHGDLNFWNDTAPTSSVFTVRSNSEVNASGQTYIAYIFTEIEGYSKFGIYTGNGSSSDGTFVHTGFKPSWVIIKTNNATDHWTIFDTKRSPINENDTRLHPDLSDAEYSGDGYGLDMLSNGFKQRSNAGAFNGSGRTYIYMAFAENPFATSGGVPVTAR